MKRKVIVLIGYPGAGKTSVARVLKEKYAWRWVDLDSEIEKRVGQPVSNIIRVEGEQRFRELESSLLDELLGNLPNNKAQERDSFDVISLGGGALLREANRSLLLQRAVVVCLDVSLDQAVRRIADDELAAFLAGRSPARPLLAQQGQITPLSFETETLAGLLHSNQSSEPAKQVEGPLRQAVRSLMDKRKFLYDIAHLHLDTDNRSSEEIADYIASQRERLLLNFGS